MTDQAKANDGTNTENKNVDNKNDDQDAAAAAAAAASLPYRPEGLPEHFYGKDEKETIDKLFTAVDGYRKKQAKDKGIPDKVDDYKIELSEEISKAILKPGDDGKDPVMEHMRGIFHARGIGSEDAAAIIQEFVSKLPGLQEGSAGGESDVDFDYKEMGGADKAKIHIDGANVFLDGLKNSGKLSDKAVDELKLLTTHSQGLTALNELRPLLGDKAIPIKLEGNSHSGGALTEADLNKLVADPRYLKDAEYRADVEAKFKAFYSPKEAA